MRHLLDIIVSIIGLKIHCAETGSYLGKALLIPWLGKIYVIGYRGEKPIKPIFLKQEKLSYWQSQIGFVTYRDD